MLVVAHHPQQCRKAVLLLASRELSKQLLQARRCRKKNGSSIWQQPKDHQITYQTKHMVVWALQGLQGLQSPRNQQGRQPHGRPQFSHRTGEGKLHNDGQSMLLQGLKASSHSSLQLKRPSDGLLPKRAYPRQSKASNGSSKGSIHPQLQRLGPRRPRSIRRLGANMVGALCVREDGKGVASRRVCAASWHERSRWQ